MCPLVMRARLRAVPGAGVRRSGAFVAPLPIQLAGGSGDRQQRAGCRTTLSRLGPAGRRAASGSSRCSGLTGQQTGRPYSASLRWTMASYSCSYVIGGSGIGCARSAR